MSGVFLACIFSTFAMTGLIWLIQRVSYPLMGHVPAEVFPAYEAFHCERITLVVLPLMTIELATSIWLAWKPIPGFETTLRSAAVLTLLLWVSTFFMQVPLHQQLEQAFDTTAWQRLVASNWIRTALWTSRSILIGWILYRGGR
ncbi:MAG: hypothetical protein ACK58L_16855 [Planctomycetota bacterium]